MTPALICAVVSISSFLMGLITFGLIDFKADLDLYEVQLMLVCFQLAITAGTISLMM